MVIQINKELCTGCSVCIDACTIGAILLLDKHAVIDHALCTQCEACTNACPSGAITAISILADITSITALPVRDSRTVPAQNPVELLKTETPSRGLTSLAGEVLAYMGREVAPRLVDVLIAALERRLARTTTIALSQGTMSSRNFIARGKGERRRARYHAGRTGYRTHKERR